jgi:hypothetical protein
VKKSLKDKWVAALRSGKYEQGRGALNHNGFCCLGVLCEVAVEIGFPIMRKESASGGITYGAGSEYGYAVLPPGFNHGLSHLQESLLARMNDMEEKSFSAIADYIDANIPGDE